MEKVANFLVNFDFEESLGEESFVLNRKSKKTKEKIAALEFIFFWLANRNESMLAHRDYSTDYIDFIKECRGFCPTHTSGEDENANTWWGELNSFEDWVREKEINSNVTAYHARKDLGYDYLNAQLCHNEEELDRAITDLNQPFLIKENFGFSGQGLHQRREGVSSYPVIVEPLVQRVRDFGIRINKDKFSLVQNLIDDRGSYKGSLIKKDLKETDIILAPSQKIFDYYRNKFEIDEIQIDSFQYLDQGELKYYPLCEINHRRSMGQLGWSLHQRFGGGVSLIAMVHRKKMKSWSSFLEKKESLGNLSLNDETKSGVLPLSPDSSVFELFFFTEETERTLQHLVHGWWKKMAVEGARLPPEYIVYF